MGILGDLIRLQDIMASGFTVRLCNKNYSKRCETLQFVATCTMDTLEEPKLARATSFPDEKRYRCQMVLGKVTAATDRF
jgi:hypothetical protein